MTTYEFAEGTESLTPALVRKAVCDYEKVIFPGSIRSLRLDFTRYANEQNAREIVFKDGVQTLRLSGEGKDIRVNFPSSIIEISACHSFLFPKVLCLPSSTRKVEGLDGVEYLQAYSHQDIYCGSKSMRHIVYLGRFPSQKTYPLGYLPKGVIIHVESREMALKLLKKVDVENAYVIPDANEWKDFPADKLSLTEKEYDARSRILPEQLDMIVQIIKKRLETRNKTKSNLSYQRERMKEQIADSVIRGALSQICPATCAMDDSHENLRVRVFLEVLNGKASISLNLDAESYSNRLNDLKTSVEMLQEIFSRYNKDLDYVFNEIRERYGLDMTLNGYY